MRYLYDSGLLTIYDNIEKFSLEERMIVLRVFFQLKKPLELLPNCLKISSSNPFDLRLFQK